MVAQAAPGVLVVFAAAAVSDDKAGTGKMATAQLQSPVKSHSHCYLFVNDLHEEEPLPGYQVSTNKAGIRASLC